MKRQDLIETIYWPAPRAAQTDAAETLESVLAPPRYACHRTRIGNRGLQHRLALFWRRVDQQSHPAAWDVAVEASIRPRGDLPPALVLHPVPEIPIEPRLHDHANIVTHDARSHRGFGRTARRLAVPAYAQQVAELIANIDHSSDRFPALCLSARSDDAECVLPKASQTRANEFSKSNLNKCDRAPTGRGWIKYV